MPSPAPPISQPLRGPSLLRLKVNTLALLSLIALRQLDLYRVWKRVTKHLGFSREATNAVETVVVLVLVFNIVQAARKLSKPSPPPALATRAAAGTPLRLSGVGGLHKGSPKTRPTPPSTLSSPSFLPSSPSPASSTPRSSTKLRPRYSLPSSTPSTPSAEVPDPSSTPVRAGAQPQPQAQPSNTPTPSRTLRSALASSTSSPQQRSPVGVSVGAGKEAAAEGSPLKVWKMRHSLGGSQTSGSPSRDDWLLDGRA